VSFWQIQRKGRSSSVDSKRSNVLASKTTRLPHFNSSAVLYESDDNGRDLLTGDDQINSFAVLCERDKAIVDPPSPRYTAPNAEPLRLAVKGTLSAIPTRLSASQLSTTYLYRTNTLTLLTYMYDSFDNHIICNSLQ